MVKAASKRSENKSADSDRPETDPKGNQEPITLPSRDKLLSSVESLCLEMKDLESNIASLVEGYSVADGLLA